MSSIDPWRAGFLEPSRSKPAARALEGNNPTVDSRQRGLPARTKGADRHPTSSNRPFGHSLGRGIPSTEVETRYIGRWLAAAVRPGRTCLVSPRLRKLYAGEPISA